MLGAFRRRSGRRSQKKNLDRSLAAITSIVGSPRDNPRMAAEALLEEYAPGVAANPRPDYRRGRPPEEYKASLLISGGWPEDSQEAPKSAALLTQTDSFIKAYDAMAQMTDFFYDNYQNLDIDVSGIQAQEDFYLPFLESLDALLVSLEKTKAEKPSFLTKRKVDKRIKELLPRRAKLFSVWQSVWSLNVDERM